MKYLIKRFFKNVFVVFDKFSILQVIASGDIQSPVQISVPLQPGKITITHIELLVNSAST